MRSTEQPLVSIGIPVYNGENYLHYAIESVLAQTYSNFELIISDNASIDATQEICREFTCQDNRIGYYRNEKNLGAGPNYDNCFRLSSGKYFKWVAHDDMIDKSYLEKTVAALENNPDAVLCFTDVLRINGNNKTIDQHEFNYPGIFSSSQSRRFLAMLRYFVNNECFFSLYRRSVLKGSELHGNYMNSDLVLMTEIALRGSFVKVAEPLFLNREHDERFIRTIYPDRIDAARWFDTRGSSRKSYRLITLYRKYIEVIKKNVSDRREKRRCFGYLLQYALTRRNLKILFFDLVFFISPWIYHNVGSIRTADINTK
ncbi:MAG TPA: glycosyltransferase family 2 protein [Gammaproteobacteria bacterium]|nr:glycosyltransferase family 2 protein [Gammaproteobacteria bacterium]